MIALIVVILLNALVPASDQFGSIAEANALVITSINPSIRPPIVSLGPHISLVPASPTPEPRQGGTWTYGNPPTPTPTVMPSENVNITITASPTAAAAVTAAPTEVPTVTPKPAAAKKGILGLGVGLPCGSLLVFPLVICGAIIGRYKRNLRSP